MHPHSQEDVIARYSALAYSIAKKYQSKGLAWEDLKQESLIGLLKAYQYYNPEKDTQFSTYASFWVRKQVLEALKQEGNIPTEEYNDAVIYESQVGNSIRPYENQKGDAEDTSGLNLPSAIPELERRIITLSFAHQKSLKEIAENLQISVERASQYKKKALRRLRAIGYIGIR